MSLMVRTLGRGTLHLAPTRTGLAFATTIVVLLLAALNYGIGLAYACAFLLAATAALSLIATQRNLRGLQIQEALPRADFAGRPVVFRVVVLNPSAVTRYGVTVAALPGAAVTIDLAPGERREVALSVPTTRRGWVVAPPVRLRSHYPFGLACVQSSALTLSARALAYPQPAARAAQPLRSAGRAAADGRGARRGGDGDFAGLAPFVVGMSPHHIHWKAAAAGRGQLVKRFAAATDTEVWLDVCGRGDIETRLANLCRQILDAEEQGYGYGVALGNQRLGPARGAAYQERCLRALALYDDAPG